MLPNGIYVSDTCCAIGYNQQSQRPEDAKLKRFKPCTPCGTRNHIPGGFATARANGGFCSNTAKRSGHERTMPDATTDAERVKATAVEQTKAAAAGRAEAAAAERTEAAAARGST